MSELMEQIREKKPIVHCITNAVTMNDCANILLAVGASPIMAHHPKEVAEISAGADALVCNFGATFDYDTMELAAKSAREHDRPIVVDPVGVAGSSYRRNACIDFIETYQPTCVRGNYAEITALIEGTSTGVGLDSRLSIPNVIDEQSAFVQRIKEYASEHNILVVASGVTDIVTDGREVRFVVAGDSMMRRVTGMGCMASVVLAAFLTVDKSVHGAATMCEVYGKAGELAAEKTQGCHGGTMTYRQFFIDELSK